MLVKSKKGERSVIVNRGVAHIVEPWGAVRRLEMPHMVGTQRTQVTPGATERTLTLLCSACMYVCTSEQGTKSHYRWL